MKRNVCTILPGIIAATAALAQPAAAQDMKAFYSGKTVSVLCPFGAGGSYGVRARLLADHIGRHLPGEPTSVPQFMPGAAGVKMVNHLYNAAPKNGTVLGLMYDGTPLAQVLRPAGIKFDARKLGAIGALETGTLGNGVLVVMKDSPATTLEALKKKSVAFGSGGVHTPQYFIAAALNELIGTKFKIISGYKGGASGWMMALEQREVYASLGGYNTFRQMRPDWFKNDQIRIVAQIGGLRHPALKDAPLLQDLTNNPQHKKILALLSSDRVVGKGVFAPPGLPKARLAALRSAFEATVKDPAFVTVYKKALGTLNPGTWRDLQAVVAETLDIEPPLARKVRSIIRAKK